MNKMIDADGLSLDDLGRVILSDSELDRIDRIATIATAGGTNPCPGSTNASNCSNRGCSGSTNDAGCSNSSCDPGTMNGTRCSNNVGGD